MVFWRPLTRVSFPLLAVALLAAGIGARPALAQVNPKISITVVDKDAKPIVGATVSLTASGEGWKPRAGATPMKDVTNKKGVVMFVWAKPDDYIVTADVPGLAINTVGLKFRDDHKRPVLDDKTGAPIEDKQGGVDPNNPIVPLSIPPKAGYVDVTLTMGPPIQAAGAAAPGKMDIKVKALNESVGLIEAQNYAGALATLDTVLANREGLKPEDQAAALYMRGFALFQLQRVPEAEAAVKESLALNPALKPAMDLLVKTQLDQKKYAEAADTMTKELELAKEPAEREPLLLNLGLALRELKRDNDALAPLEEAYKINPNDPQITVQLADLYTSLGRAADAEKLMGANLPPDQAALLHFNMAATLLRQKNWAGAEQHFRTAVELDPKLVDAHRYIGDALLRQDKRQEALAAYEKFLEVAPNAPEAAVTKQVADALKADLKNKQQQQKKTGGKK